MTVSDVEEIAHDARNDGLDDATIIDMFKRLIVNSSFDNVKEIVDTAIEEIDVYLFLFPNTM